MSAWSPSPELAEELDRVGVSYGKAGAANYAWALDLGDFVDLLGPPSIQPRPHWRASTEAPRGSALALRQRLMRPLLPRIPHHFKRI
jgi:hypothetical protein